MNTLLETILTRKGSKVLTTTADTTVEQAVAEMNRHNVGALVVLDRQRVSGIFSERDVLVRVVAAGLDPANTAVGEAMTLEPYTASPQMTLEQAMKLITEKRCRHLPVVDAAGRLVGLVSIGDLLYTLLDYQKEEIDELRSYITDTPPGALLSSTG